MKGSRKNKIKKVENTILIVTFLLILLLVIILTINGSLTDKYKYKKENHKCGFCFNLL